MKEKEREILIHASDLNPDPETTRYLLSRDVDADTLIEAAIQEGLAGFLYKSLPKSDSPGFLDPLQTSILESAYYRTLRANLLLIRDLKEVLHELNQRNIPMMLLQGMDLLHGIYEDIGLRPLTDIDVWIREEHYPAAVALLGRFLYEKDSNYPTVFRRGTTTFDLHTHIVWADRIKARRRLLDGGAGEVSVKTQPVSVQGEEALCLDPCDQFIYLGLHALKHRANRLVWLVDLKTLAGGWKESEWKALLDRAGEMGQEKTVSYILYLLRSLFHFPLPEDAGGFPRLGPLERRVLDQRIRGSALPAWGPAFLFASGKGLIRGLPIFLESLFPRPEILRQVFPDSSRAGAVRLYLKRTRHLLGMLKGALSPQRPPKRQRKK
jgi:hypothetical protein